MFQALSSLSETEMAPAVGLILKLASEAGGSREKAVRTVRSSIRGQAEPSNGTLDAVRLAVAQHPDVAAAMLADIDADCRAVKIAAPMEVRRFAFRAQQSRRLGSCVEELQRLLVCLRYNMTANCRSKAIL